VPSRTAIAARARVDLGRLAFAGFREWGLLERLLEDDERIEAMAHGKLTGGGAVARQRIVVATDRRLWLVEKGFLTGRERVEQHPWDDVRGFEPHPPSRIVIALADDAKIELSFLQAPQLARLADTIGRHAPGGAPRHSARELQEVARRKLGRLTAFSVEGNVIALATALDGEEEVLDLVSTVNPDGLLAVTTRGVAFVPTVKGRAGAVERTSYDDFAPERYKALVPEDRAVSLLQVVEGRLSS
jgi:hypothetical protein